MAGMIHPVVMPKWGLAMTEGKVVAWLADEGAPVADKAEILEIETSKITNVFEAPAAGVLRRRLVAVGDTVPVGALLGVIADADVPEAEIDAFIAGYAAEQAAAEAAGAGAAAEPEIAELGTQRVRYLRLGSGGDTPALLIHGFGADLNNWLFNQPMLAERTTTYAVDLPGHGGSSKAIDDGSIASLASTVAAFRRALGLGRVHLVGHSLGGAVALELALNDPESVASLTLIAPAGLGPEINSAFIEGFIQAGRRKDLQPVLETLVADPALISRDMVEDILKFKRLDGAVAALRRIADAAFAGGRQAIAYNDRLGRLGMPAQVIWGRADRVIPAHHAERVPEPIRTHVIEQSGHMPHMERAAEVNSLLLELIRG